MVSNSAIVDIGRLVLLVDAFSAGVDGRLDGLTKLAKLDFLLRYPACLEALNAKRKLAEEFPEPNDDERRAIDAPMIRYKYGPWDERYYSLVGGLVGRGLASYESGRGRVALKITETGAEMASSIRAVPSWRTISDRVAFLSRHYDLPGSVLKDLLYDNLPALGPSPLRTRLEPAAMVHGA
jgi:hypothetical protein